MSKEKEKKEVNGRMSIFIFLLSTSSLFLSLNISDEQDRQQKTLIVCFFTPMRVFESKKMFQQ
jgi:hypothetical protein